MHWMARRLLVVLLVLLGAQPTFGDPLPSMKAPAKGQPLRIFPYELDDFVKVVESDPVILPKAEALVVKRKAGHAVETLGVLTLVGLSVPGALMYKGCQPRMDMSLDCSDRDLSRALIISGGVLGVGIFMLGWAISPSRQSFVEAISGWNARHPDAPIELRAP